MASIKKDLDDLIEAGVIDWETGDKIRNYYQKQPQNPNRILLAFGILAAVLIGLGIILIIGHNWDNFTVSVKTGIAFLPLLASLLLVGYTILKESESQVWREVGGICLFFGVAAAIAMIGQIYHVEGAERSFIRTWLLLAIPITYVLPSSAVSLLTFLGLMGLGASSGAGWHTSIKPLVPYDQLFIFLLALPHYIYICRSAPKKNFTLVHHWIVTWVFCMMLIPRLFGNGGIGILSILVALSLLYGIGTSEYFKDARIRWNPPLLVGSIGTVLTLFFASFIQYWKFADGHTSFNFSITHDYIMIFLFLGALYFLIRSFKTDNFSELNPLSYCFLLFIPIYLLGIYSPVFAMIATNLLLGGIGLYYIIFGNKKQRLALLNFGMFIISALILARFFEIDLSFVARGICFVVIGLMFFGANYFLINKSKLS